MIEKWVLNFEFRNVAGVKAKLGFFVIFVVVKKVYKLLLQSIGGHKYPDEGHRGHEEEKLYPHEGSERGGTMAERRRKAPTSSSQVNNF